MMTLNLFLTLFLSLTSIFNNTEVKHSSFATFASDAKALTDKSIKILPEGYTLLKSYTIDRQGGVKTQLDYQYIFSKGTTYIVTLSKIQPGVDKLVIRLYDASQREIMGSYSSGKYNNYVTYQCDATGIYHLKFSCEKGMLEELFFSIRIKK